jgi:hypothetical protein
VVRLDALHVSHPGCVWRINPFLVVCLQHSELGKVKVVKPAGPAAKSATEDDDYEDDFDEPGTPKAATITPASPLKPLTHMRSSDFEQKDLADLTASLESCVNTLVLNVKSCTSSL